jgi:hypothetical protein
MWSPADSQRIQTIARDIVPDVRTFALPYGMQVEKGPDAVVEYVKENLDDIIFGNLEMAKEDTSSEEQVPSGSDLNGLIAILHGSV